MPNILQVSALSDETQRYDLLIATLGYESRARTIAEKLAPHTDAIFAFDYAQHHVHAYSDNRRFFAMHTIVDEPEPAHRKILNLLVEAARERLTEAEPESRRALRVAVDISCMDRDRLARTVMALSIDQSQTLEVDYHYSFAEFEPDLVGSEGTVLVNRPVEGLEGWPSDPDSGLVCLLGLGFESRLALAAVETLEPSRVIALVPRGEDVRYDSVVDERNASLLASEDVQSAHHYGVQDVLRTLLDLNASVEALSRRARVVLVPLGPKTLALASILVAIAHPTNTTVWRLSADDGRQPEDRVATGTVAGLRVRVGGPPRA